MLRSNKISKRSTAITFAIILIIFSIGFVLRVESVHLSGIPDNEKSFYQDQNGLPYMYELDSYYNYRLTRNYLDHGYLGDKIVNGNEWDSYSYYPPGVPMDYQPLIVYITAFFYKLVNLFANMPLLVVCFWIPAFLAPLSGVVAYLFVRRFINEYGAVVAGILAVTAPFYFIRTVPGWFDTDMFNIVFPLLIIWLLIESVQSKNIRMQIFFGALSGFFMFLFATAWNGWQYLFYLILLFCIFYIVFGKLKAKNVNNIIYAILTFSIVTLLLVDVFTGFLNIIKLLNNPFELIKLSGNNSPWSSWPNVYISVSELGKPSIEETISGVGIAFFAGILGLFWMLRVFINKKLKKQYLNKISWFFYLFLIVWIITGIFALTEGARFILILLPPLIVSSGIMVGICIGYLDVLKNIKNPPIFKRKKYLIKLISLCIVFIIITPAIINAYESCSTLTPGANDDLWAASEWIHNNTADNTVIISEWGYGHLFTVIADRPVIFDGRMGYLETLPVRDYDSAFTFGSKSPSTSREYWIDKAFSTDNESLSIGIFRMLSTSGDAGYLTLDEYTENTAKSVEILNNILGVDKNTAKNILQNNYHLNQNQMENVLKYTHHDNPSPFVIVTADGMTGIGKWIFNFGGWDFNRRESANYTYSIGNITIDKDILKSSNNVTMNLKTGNTTLNGKVPYCTITITKGKVEKHYLDKNNDLCAILLLDNDKSIVIDKRFENSLFVKLVIEKVNTSHFETMYKNKKVIVWNPTSR